MPVLMADAFGISSSEARRLIKQGGVKLDGETAARRALDLAPAELDGKVLQAGKRRFRRLCRALPSRASAMGKRGAASAILPGPSGAGPGLTHA